MTQRVYRSVRIAAGDYLQPANDAKSLWRIARYDEDNGRSYWGTWRYERLFQNAGEWTEPDFLEWSNWLMWDSYLPTKRAAVEAALKAAERVR
jgi:hypothetical protein